MLIFFAFLPIEFDKGIFSGYFVGTAQVVTKRVYIIWKRYEGGTACLR